MRRLKKDGLVRVNADGHVRLTAAGLKIARSFNPSAITLFERMLSEIFGMALSGAPRSRAPRHAVSPAFEGPVCR